jgi:type VI secretion system protein ImpE
VETSASLYQQGRLADAIELLNGEVKAKPADIDRRGLLAEFLCIAGDLERAEKQLEAAGRVAPDRALGVALLRQLVRAEQARQQFFAEGRLPEFVGKPDAALEQRLRASVALRTGQAAEAVELLDALESARAPLKVTADGKAYADLRDLDDLIGDVLEVLTSTGKYFWIPLARVRRIEMRKPERPRDLLWRRALVDVKDGPEGEVFLPAIYAASYGPGDDAFRLGRRTEWSEGAADGRPVRGRGLRTLLLGDEARTLLELSTLELAGAS